MTIGFTTGIDWTGIPCGFAPPQFTLDDLAGDPEDDRYGHVERDARRRVKAKQQKRHRIQIAEVIAMLMLEDEI